MIKPEVEAHTERERGGEKERGGRERERDRKKRERETERERDWKPVLNDRLVLKIPSTWCFGLKLKLQELKKKTKTMRYGNRSKWGNTQAMAKHNFRDHLGNMSATMYVERKG